jgi:hypothetical protein
METGNEGGIGGKKCVFIGELEIIRDSIGNRVRFGLNGAFESFPGTGPGTFRSVKDVQHHVTIENCGHDSFGTSRCCFQPKSPWAFYKDDSLWNSSNR